MSDCWIVLSGEDQEEPAVLRSTKAAIAECLVGEKYVLPDCWDF